MNSVFSQQSQQNPHSHFLEDGVALEVRASEFARSIRRTSLTDSELERHIKSCAWLMEDAMNRYYESGCFSHRGTADRWRLLMEEAIRSRSPAQVAKMERERGLA